LGGLLVTMWHNAPLVVQGEARMREAFPGRVFRTVIRRTDKVGESAYYRESVLDYSPTSAAARDYRKFVDEYFGGEANGEK
ncbi:MAG TPA: ParA family protein, partial [Candidatus Agathobaculum merdavium]|nr:ParA family protein [Candidatus Agathobaculum merdavium]